MKIYFVRHGEILSNIKKVYAGRSLEALTKTGVYQASVVADKLKSRKVAALYTSPIVRAGQTADIIGQKTSMTASHINEFRELDMGPWEGMSEKDIAAQYPAEWEIWNNKPADLSLPGRETLHELQQRVLKGLQIIEEDIGSGCVTIVTHVAIIRVALLWSLGENLNKYKSIHVPNAEIFNVQINEFPFV